MRRRTRRVLALCSLPLAATACTDPPPRQAAPASPPARSSAPVPQQPPGPGAAGAGDPYYPADGNGGYDALDYAVTAGYDPASGKLDGDTTVTARATQDLTRFNLDLRGFEVASVEVNGQAAEFAREGEFELVTTPPATLPAGSTFTVRVRYAGIPSDSDAGQLGKTGWQRSSSGGGFVVGEPHSAAFWYPVNETPRDKATFHLTARVPEGWTAISIGTEAGGQSADGWTTTSWAQERPVASYLTMIAVDRFSVDRRTLADGTPVLDAYAPGAEARRADGGRLPEILDFLSAKFGRYPQTSAGGTYLASKVGFSLETQGRPIYTQGADLETVVHENAHQWFGDAVSVKSWADICLNECLASYSEWLWSEGTAGQDLDARYHRAIDRLDGDDDFWQQKLYDMGTGEEFGGVYDKGTLAIHALRRELGEETFDRVLPGWVTEHDGGNASWPEFEAYLSAKAGRDLRPFLDAWFHGTELPADEYLYPGSLRR